MATKRRKRMLWSVALLLVIPALWWCAAQSGYEAQAEARFRADRKQLEEIALWVLERGSAEGVQPPAGWREIRYFTQDVPVVDFALGGWGIGSQTVYRGIQYVPDDRMAGFQGSRWDHWTQRDGGRLYYEPDGDNQCYVKRLDRCWYYYEARF